MEPDPQHHLLPRGCRQAPLNRTASKPGSTFWACGHPAQGLWSCRSLRSVGPSGGGLAGWQLEGISRRSLWLVPVSRTMTRPRPRPAGAAARRSWPCQSRGSAGCAGSPDWLSRLGCERDRTQGDPVGAKLSERVGVAERLGCWTEVRPSPACRAQLFSGRVGVFFP